MKMRAFVDPAQSNGDFYSRSFERDDPFRGFAFLLEVLHVDEPQYGFSAGGREAFYRLAEEALKCELAAGTIAVHELTSSETLAAVENGSVPLHEEREFHPFDATFAERSQIGATVSGEKEADLVLRTFWLFLRVMRLTCRISH